MIDRGSLQPRSIEDPQSADKQKVSLMSKSNQTIATLNQAPRRQGGSVFTSTLDTNGCFIDELSTPDTQRSLPILSDRIEALISRGITNEAESQRVRLGIPRNPLSRRCGKFLAATLADLLRIQTLMRTAASNK